MFYIQLILTCLVPSLSSCKGSCYCPETCDCSRKGYVHVQDQNSADQCPKMDCPPKHGCSSRCRSSKREPQNTCCQLKFRSPAEICCATQCSFSDCCDSCHHGSSCGGPYCPPPRKPICYPPVMCCEENPCERICYYPRQMPCQPKYCTCGSPNPCDCDLGTKRLKTECERAPCCRRCGCKVLAYSTKYFLV